LLWHFQSESSSFICFNSVIKLPAKIPAGNVRITTPKNAITIVNILPILETTTESPNPMVVKAIVQ
jgi:hypothetical protein